MGNLRSDDEAATFILEKLRWGDGPRCPYCNEPNPYRVQTRKVFKCRSCYRNFSVTSGTPFSSRKLSHAKCLEAMLLYEESNGYIRPFELAKELEITSKTATALKYRLWEGYCNSEGFMAGPCIIIRGYWQGYNRFILGKDGVVMRQNIHGTVRVAWS